MRRFGKLAAVALAGGMVLGGLTACASKPDPDYARVCVDKDTHERVEPNKCGAGDNPSDANSSFIYWYLIYGSLMPRYGQPVYGGSHYLAPTKSFAPTESAPAGKSYTKPSKNWTPPKTVAPRVAPAPAPKPQPGPAPKAPSTGKSWAPAPKAPAPTYRAPAPTFRAPTPVRVGR
jgi:hypothetical protein